MLLNAASRARPVETAASKPACLDAGSKPPGARPAENAWAAPPSSGAAPGSLGAKALLRAQRAQPCTFTLAALMGDVPEVDSVSWLRRVSTVV
ncbi:hypothetical protein [Bordetella bronchiseptica]|uniref:hypothetical protein n=1 Tax=Bordetella bronchiseptica TaxID=518 RepID=UPI0005B353EB|nr:hypothetical protein [Bordetella bronchiseptica]